MIMRSSENTLDPRFLGESMPVGPGIEPQLRDALDYSLETKGSFSRAMLCVAVCDELGMSQESGQAIGSSVELFHLASLILDDLPSMDDAKLRRGEACVHEVYGESTAILASLGFINRGYALFWRQMNKVDSNCAEEAADLIESSLGLEGVLNGQARDLNFCSRSGQELEVERIALLKTGALFRLCLLLPAILGGGSRYEKLHLARLSESWGIAYQIADDLKDVLFGEDSSGKSTQKDEQLGRPNMALQVGVEAALTKLRLYLKDADHSLNALADTGGREWNCLLRFHNEFLEKMEPILRNQEVA